MTNISNTSSILIQNLIIEIKLSGHNEDTDIIFEEEI